jgi:phosphopantetheinyl transferase
MVEMTRLSALNLKGSIPIQAPALDRIESTCKGFVLIEMDTLFPVPENMLTPREAARVDKFGPRRRKSFTAARVALKELAYKLGLVEGDAQASNIETLDANGVRPVLPASGVYSSVSHDDIFVVAVANDKPIGVDIEPISDKAARGWHIFMSLSERCVISETGLGTDRTVLRAWTMKEAAAKALDLDLVQAWREVQVLRIGVEKSLARVKGRETPVTHLEIQGHVLSLFTFDDV